MTALEMQRMVEIVYESIASNPAPGYDEYEWSVILTDAQAEIVKDVIKEGIDKNDFNRLTVRPLIKYLDDNQMYTHSGLPNTYVVKQSTLDYKNVWLIVREVINADPLIKVKPVSYDFMTSNLKNPYKKPTTKLVWRSLINEESGGEVLITVPSGMTITNYELVYLERPEPIIVPGVDLNETIDGVTVDQTINSNGQNSNLNTKIHKDIVHKAASLAKLYTSDLQGWQAHLAEIKNKNIV